MAERETQRQVIVREPWWLSRIKEFFKMAFYVIGLVASFIGLYYIATEIGLVAGIFWLLIAIPTFYKLIKVAGPKIVEVDLETRQCKFLKVPWPLWAKWQKEGEVATNFIDEKGNPVLFAEEVKPEQGYVRFAWLHSLNAVEYVMSANTFLSLREEFREKILRLAELELTFSEQLARVGEGKVAKRVKFLLGEGAEQEVARILERWKHMRWKHGPTPVAEEAGEVG